jgi:hypothetical protein
MTPAQYQGRYENLPVHLGDGSITTVPIHQYGRNPAQMDFEARGVFLRTLASNGIDRDLTVETSTGGVRVIVLKPPELDNLAKKEMPVRRPYRAELTPVLIHPLRGGQPDPDSDAEKQFIDFALLARYAFAGKGSPEACQIVLQLADGWGLLKDGPQKYADRALGLGSNGFAANYAWHERSGKAWYEVAIPERHLGPDAWISDYLKTEIVYRSCGAASCRRATSPDAAGLFTDHRLAGFAGESLTKLRQV